jgi:hypothetical protein
MCARRPRAHQPLVLKLLRILRAWRGGALHFTASRLMRHLTNTHDPFTPDDLLINALNVLQLMQTLHFPLQRWRGIFNLRMQLSVAASPTSKQIPANLTWRFDVIPVGSSSYVRETHGYPRVVA